MAASGTSIGTRRLIEVLLAANQHRCFRILAAVDDCTRECLAFIANTSISDRRVARELDDMIHQWGRPSTIVSDNGMASGRRLLPQKALAGSNSGFRSLVAARSAPLRRFEAFIAAGGRIRQLPDT